MRKGVVALILLTFFATAIISVSGHTVALRKRLSDFALAAKTASNHPHAVRMQAASGAMLAYYDEEGNWVDEQPIIYYETPYPAVTPDQVPNTVSIPWNSIQTDPCAPTTVEEMNDGSSCYAPIQDINWAAQSPWYSVPDYGPAYDPSTYQPMPMGGADQGYVPTSDSNVLYNTDTQTYYDPISDTHYDPSSNTYYDPNTDTTYDANTGAVIGSSQPYDQAYSYYQQQPVQQSWYQRMLPGFSSIITPLLPPLYQPTSVSPIYIEPQPPAPQPDCQVAVSPQTIAYGGSAIVSWISRNATRASLNNYGSIPLSGSQTLNNLTSSRTFGVTVSGPGGDNACYATLVVQPQPQPPTCMISAYPADISHGQSANLAWNSSNASSATLSGIGPVAPSGGTMIAPTQTASFTLTVSGNGRSGSCSTRITVH
ncbi:MAG: hypothetical protein JO019_02185 [Candidatus Kaiserbacteria bacterium]|nr:hypothetical protein [Candidatus Kaiserbacteria bacterium]